MAIMTQKTRIGMLCLLCLCTLPPIAWAGPEEDGGYWLNLHLQGPLPMRNLNWSMDTNPRWRNEGKHLNDLYLRPALFYRSGTHASWWLGHDSVVGHPDGKPAYHEQRWWEQFQYQFDPVANFTLASRTRLEERSREGYHAQGRRLRQMLKITRPFTAHPHLSWVLSDELFINLNQTDWGVQRGFDQNRLFLGLHWTLSARCSLESGYLNQYSNGHTIDRENHVLSTTLGVRF